MSRRIILISLVFLILFPGSVFASISINEVQLSPTENRFIELYNSGDLAVDLTGWYIQRKTATGSTFGSLISSTNFEGKSIGSHDYFLISKTGLSNSDIVLSFTLTESNTIQIKNSDGAVVDKLGWGDSTECSNVCPANPPSGESIYKTSSGSWLAGTPTPSSINETSTNSSVNETDSVSAGTEESTVATSTTPKQKIKTKISTKNVAFVGIPMEMNVGSTGFSGETLQYGTYYLNFGDGDSREMKANKAKQFTHIYFYPGDYDVNLEYYLTYYSGNPDAVDRRVVKVVAPDIVISNVGKSEDFFIELTNNTNYEADLSRWILFGVSNYFTFPKNTILSSKKKIILAPQITGLSVEDKENLKLMTPDRQVISTYNVPVVRTKTTKSAPQIGLEALSGDVVQEDLSASVINSADGNSYVPVFGFILFLGASSSAVYFIRRKKRPMLSGDDFELMDE